MNVIALVDFHDNLKNCDRRRGEEFVVTKERFEQINAVGAEKIGGPIVEEVRREPAPAKESPESRAKKAPAKRRAAAKKTDGD